MTKAKPRLTEEQKAHRKKARRALRVALEWRDADEVAGMKARVELGRYLAELERRHGPPQISDERRAEIEAFCAHLGEITEQIYAEREARIEALREQVRLS